jgi:hypothetical protein
LTACFGWVRPLILYKQRKGYTASATYPFPIYPVFLPSLIDTG